MIGRVLNGRYQLSALLGEGGMAVVYEAEDLLLGRKVAVKVLREQFAADPGFLARFQREARSSAALSHPNIVAVYDVGSEAGTQYIVMELVPGRTLKEILQEEAPLGAARIIELGRQICEGLEYAHQHGIVHRDVKAHNILVTRDGWAKIADFGIAVALGAASLTQSGYVVGSAHYISPEQAKGEQSTASSDLYATGVLLYEMATGRLPFEGETSVVVALKQIQEDPVPPRRLNPRIPESL
ncbi:MAG: protein kinase, partial [Chloroflexi bacterium]|nr:protein kinase [Chloroflexota bacterium]